MLPLIGAGLDDNLATLISERAQASRPVCVYAYDLDKLTEHVSRVISTLPGRCRMFYAMKANSAEPLLHALAPLVAGFEVASGGELTKARAVDRRIPIIVGGPAKTEEMIAQALEQSATRFHAESVLELHRISAVAGRTKRVAEVLLRINLTDPLPAATLFMAGRPTQFGIDEAVLPEAVDTARRLPHLRMVGFHLHSVSNILCADAHLDMLDLYCRKITGWERQFGLACEVVNFGGGIGVNYVDLARQFDWQRFTQGLNQLIERSVPAHWREIDFECGRFLVAACGYYAVEILDVKRNHGENYLVVRGGTHHFRLPASWQHSHPFTVVPLDQWSLGCPRPEVCDKTVTVVGELCTPKDVLARDVMVTRVRAGDVLVFHHAGAYGWEISHHDFLSHPHPEHVFRRKDTSRGRPQSDLNWADPRPR